MVEHDQSNGCSGVYACGQLNHARYINPKLEKELVDFKIEVEGKFKASALASFTFPLLSELSKKSTIISEKEITTFGLENDTKISRQGQRTGRKLIDTKIFINNYATNHIGSRNDPSANISINYDQSYESAVNVPNNRQHIRGRYGNP